MTGKEAVAEVLKRIKEGRCVKVWTADRSEEIAAHWCGMYIIYYQGRELCRGLNGAAEIIREKFENQPKVYIL